VPCSTRAPSAQVEPKQQVYELRGLNIDTLVIQKKEVIGKGELYDKREVYEKGKGKKRDEPEQIHQSKHSSAPIISP